MTETQNKKLQKFKVFSSQAIKNFFFFLILLGLILFIFHSVLGNIFADYFLMDKLAEKKFNIYFLIFSLLTISLYAASAFYIYRKVFAPIPKVLKRIEDIKNYKRENSAEDYFTALSDFWDLIEEEVLEVAKVTGRRQRQSDRIRRALEQILSVFPESTIIVNSEGKINYYNRAFKSLFMNEVHEGAIYLYDLFRDPQILSLVQGLQEEGTTKKEIQVALGGSEVKKHFIVYSTPFAAKYDSASEQMIVFHDITSSKLIDQMKTDFVSNVSHELRTPMMSIQGYVQTLKEDVKSKRLDQADKFFEIIESHVERLNLLINDLLQLSYLESDASLEKETIEVKPLTQKILKQFSLDFNKGEYVIKEVYEADHVRGDSRLIEQVLTNLLQNALRYTPLKTEISLSWEKEGPHTVLVYKDNGPGISEEHVNRIFERFYRIDPHRSRSRGGTGLGLSIVKHIMQKHGGSIEVKSDLGHGIEFRCLFPE